MLPNKNKKKVARGPRKSRRGARAPNREMAKSPNLGESIGATLGSKLGGFVHRTIGRLFGKGEYRQALASETGVGAEEIAEPNATPEVNSLVQPLSNQDLVPIVHSGREGTIVIRKREFVRTLTISDVAVLSSFKVNPGRLTLFPWLFRMARNFQEYKVLGLAMEYVPTSGFAVGSTNAALGQVVMAFQYNVIYQNGTSFPATSDIALLNMAGATSCSPAAVGACYLECAEHLRTQNQRFVYTEDPSLLEAHSLQNIDVAEFFVRTSGAQNNTFFNCGQLWVTYEIELSLPRVQDPAALLDGSVYSEAIDLYWELERYAGPFDKQQICAVEMERCRLRCLFDTPDFRMWLAKKRCRQVLDDQVSPVELDKRLAQIMADPQATLALDDEEKSEIDGYVHSGLAAPPLGPPPSHRRRA